MKVLEFKDYKGRPVFVVANCITGFVSAVRTNQKCLFQQAQTIKMVEKMVGLLATH